MDNYIDRAKSWLTSEFDSETINKVNDLINGNLKELEDSFYKNLDFGTGGLRGVMGVGTNRVNQYTIGMATQGLANYLSNKYSNQNSVLSVAIAFDSRNNSKYFAEITANVFSSNGFKVYLYNDIKPTPQLSYTIRHLKCCAGVMITASHNPKEYNGYKVYGSDGAQVVSPEDNQIIEYVREISSPLQVKFKQDINLIEILNNDIDSLYIKDLKSLSLMSDINLNIKESLKIVYTPLHGTGVKLVPKALNEFGFNNVHIVPEQAISDGNFPTVVYPNPEESEALKMAVSLAEEISADIVMATDPDADRLGVAIRDNVGKIALINGNQMASILTFYLLERMKELGKISRDNSESYYMVKTIVTTDLMHSICREYNIKIYDVLTGFKYIGEVVRNLEGKKYFIGGGEESYGFNIGEFVRDKDAVITASMLAEAAVWAKSKGMSLYDLLIDIYSKFGFYKEDLLSVTKKGKDGIEQISAIMKGFRENPPHKLNDSDIVLIHDYQRQESIDLVSDLRYKINLPKSNVIQFVSRDNTIVSIRPSGTEPKIKYYFGVKGSLQNKENYDVISHELELKIVKLKEQFSNI